MKSFHIIQTDGTERDVTENGIEVRDGSKRIGMSTATAVIYAPGAWVLVEIQRKDD
jgi:hypothetical protein